MCVINSLQKGVWTSAPSTPPVLPLRSENKAIPLLLLDDQNLVRSSQPPVKQSFDCTPLYTLAGRSPMPHLEIDLQQSLFYKPSGIETDVDGCFQSAVYIRLEASMIRYLHGARGRLRTAAVMAMKTTRRDLIEVMIDWMDCLVGRRWSWGYSDGAKGA